MSLPSNKSQLLSYIVGNCFFLAVVKVYNKTLFLPCCCTFLIWGAAATAAA